MKAFVFKMSFVVFFFLYIYSVQFSFLPIPIGTRVGIGAIGVAILCCQIFVAKNAVIPIKFISVCLSLLTLPIISIFSCIYNQTSDWEFVRYAVSISIIFFAAYSIIYIFFRVFPNGDGKTLMRIFILVTSLQLVIAFLAFLNPAIGEVIRELEFSSDLDSGLLQEVGGFRLVGLGSRFFGAGVVNGFSLILIGFLLRKTKVSLVSHLALTMSFIGIFVIGMMMARSTMIGGILGVLLIFSPSLKGIRRSIKFLLTILVIVGLIGLIIHMALPSVWNSLESAFKFGFELFINYSQAGSFESSSTNELKEMYKWPDQLKTYIIGDGYYTDPYDANYYYKGIDVGYIRLIYYFGVIGLFAYLQFQMRLIWNAYWKRGYFSLFSVTIIYLLVLNFKGFTDLIVLVFPFCLISYRNKIGYSDENSLCNSISAE